MPQYRTVEAISLVRGGKAVSIAANRLVELTEPEADKLGDKVAVSVEEDSVFPKGQPIIPAGFRIPEPVAEVDPKTLVSELPKPKK